MQSFINGMKIENTQNQKMMSYFGGKLFSVQQKKRTQEN